MAFPEMHSLYGRALGVTPTGTVTGEVGISFPAVAATSAMTAVSMIASSALGGANLFVGTTDIEPYASAQSLTSASTGTAVRTYGITSITGSTNKAYTMTAPVAGMTKSVVALSTHVMTVTLVSGNFINGIHTEPVLTAASTIGTRLTLDGVGQTIVLRGLSTTLYVVEALTGFSTSTAAGFVVSTSTA